MKKSEVSVGMKCYWVVDDRPLDTPVIETAIVSAIFDDHFLFDVFNKEGILLCPKCWGEYDENPDDTNSIVFATMEEAKTWLRKRGH